MPTPVAGHVLLLIGLQIGSVLGLQVGSVRASHDNLWKTKASTKHNINMHMCCVWPPVAWLEVMHADMLVVGAEAPGH